MTKHVLVVDYGVGNLLSVCRAFEACGADVELSGNAGAASPRPSGWWCRASALSATAWASCASAT